jgi:hypothetical protein
VASSGRLQAAVAGVGNPDTPCLLACRDCSLDCLPGGLSVVSLITGANPAPSRSDRRERVGRGYNVPRIEDSGVRTNRGAIRQRRHRFLLHGMVLVPPWLNSVLRCSPRLRRCSSTTRNAHRRLWPSVHPGGVGHSEPPVKGSLRSLGPSPEPRSGGLTRRLRLVNAVSTSDASSDTETGSLSSTSDGRAAPSAVGQGSSPFIPSL